MFHRHAFTYNPSQLENMTWDNSDEKTGMLLACKIINEQLSPLLHGKDATLFKKMDDALMTFKERE